MKKYSEIAEITSTFLLGKLQKLTMEYVNPENLKVSILYEDAYDYYYDYDLIIDPETKKYDFLSHSSVNPLFRFSLDRDQKFEEAVCTYLCKSLAI